MTNSNLSKLIKFEIEKQYKSVRAYALSKNINYNSFSKTLTCMEKDNRCISFRKLENILSDIGYEIIIKKK